MTEGAGQEMTLNEYVTNTLPNSHLANRQLVELREAAHDYASLVQVEHFRVADSAVHRAYERLRKALAESV